MLEENIPNPFPQVGTPGSIKIDPVGYDEKLLQIKKMVRSNLGKQPIILNIFGDYGTGKTTILEFLKGKLKGEWGNLTLIEKGITDLKDIEKELIAAYEKHVNEGTEGVLFLIDEAQIAVLNKINEKDYIQTFMNTLRKFADNNIANMDSGKFVLCIAMTQQTKLHFEDYSFYDVEQRTQTFTLNLKEIDYYMAYMLIKNHFNRIKEDFDLFFDESFINAFYVLSSHLELQKEGLNRVSGRTYVQLFFNLFEFIWRKKLKRLDFNDLKDILLGNENLEWGNVKVLLANDKPYYELINEMGPSEIKTFDKLVFNPKWYFTSDFEESEIVTLEDLVYKGYVSKRECLILDSKSSSELKKEIKTELEKYSDKEDVYLDGKRTLYFLDTVNPKIKQNLKNYPLKYVYRLKEDYLSLIYDFKSQESVSSELIKYYKLKPSQKVRKFYDILKKFNQILINPKEVKCKKDTKYLYLEGVYKTIGKIEYNVAIFYYTPEYASVELEKYFNDIKSELKDSNHDFAVLFICPYYNSELPDENTMIRDMENRMFINKFKKDEFMEILKDNTGFINQKLLECTKLFMNESVEKGYTLPLTGFKQKIKNKPTLFKEKFLSDIRESWDIEKEKRFDEPKKERSNVLIGEAIDGDGKLEELAKLSLSEFVKLDYGFITGSKLSKYEKNFLSLFGTDNVAIDEIKRAQEKYFATYSRFPIDEYIPEILKIKNLLKEENGHYNLLKPLDFVPNIIKTLNSVDMNEIIKNKQNTGFKRAIFDLKILMDKLDTRYDNILEKGLDNYEMLSIQRKFESIKKEDTRLVQEIMEKYEDIQNKITKTWQKVSFSDIDFSKNLDVEKFYKSLPLHDNRFRLSKINSGSLQEFIAKILSSNVNWEIDKEVLFALEYICEKSKHLNLEKDSYTDINQLKSKLDAIKEKISNNAGYNIQNRLEDLFNGEESDFGISQLEDIYKILENLDFFVIDPTYKKLEDLSRRFDEIKKTKLNLSQYKPLFTKLNTFNRSDIYLDEIKNLNFNLINSKEEEEPIKRLLIFNINLLDGYLKFLENNSGEEISKGLKRLNSAVIENESRNLSEYIAYVSNLDEHEYFNYYLKKSIDGNVEISEKDLISIIDGLKISENETMDSKNIINEIILPKGDIKRTVYFEEYYKNGKLVENNNKKIAYKLRRGE